MDEPKPLEIMKIGEAASYLRISKWVLYRHVKDGKVPGVKIGGSWRFKKDILEAVFLQEK
jgi:excisionase family DNA binding protein